MSAFVSAVSSAISRLFEGRAPAALRTLASYAGQILAMRPAGTADIATDDETIGGPGGVGGRPVLVGLPGVRLDMTGGDRVRLGFEAGSPASAEVIGFEQDRSADRGAARHGDKVKLGEVVFAIGSFPGPPVLPLLIVSYRPLVSPFVTEPPLVPPDPIILSIFGSIVSGITPGVQYDVEGWITTGSIEILLRRVDSEEIP